MEAATGQNSGSDAASGLPPLAHGVPITDAPPSDIDQRHWDGWISSGVAPHIIELNVKTLCEPQEIDKLLNRNNKRRWQHWEHGAGWRVVGVDPETDEVSFDGVQFKPDKPVQRVGKDGEPKFKRDGSPDHQKYISASDHPSEPLFLSPGIPDYWQDILTDVSKPVILTEGGKKAGAGLTRGKSSVAATSRHANATTPTQQGFQK